MARTKYVFPAFVVLIINLVISIYLSRHHYHLTYALQDTKSVCNVSQVMDCDAVNTSVYSEFFGIPIALVSTLVALVQLLLLFGYRILAEDERRRPLRFLFYISILQVLFSLGLAVISATVLKTFCLMCSLMYACNILLFIFAYLTLNKPRFKFLGGDIQALFKPSSQGGSLGILFLLVAIPVGSLLGHSMYMSSLGGDISAMTKASIEKWEASRTFEFNTADAPRVGNPNAPIKIVEFFDFQCGHCRRAAHSIHAFGKSHFNEVEIAYQNYPLDGQCNTHIQGSGNGRSCEMAKASLCAHEQGKFMDAYFWIFDHQGLFNDQTTKELKAELKLDEAKFDSCMIASATTAEVSKQTNRGGMTGIRGTPAIFFQGKELEGGFLIPILEAALKKSQKK